MAVVVRELERTGAFDRKLLVIIPTTGTGWVNPGAPRGRSRRCTTATPRWSACSTRICRAGFRSSATSEKSIESGRLMIDADPRPLAAAAAGPAAQAGAVRREPRLDGGAGRVRLAARHRGDGLLRRCCGWARRNASPLWSGLTVRRDPGTPEVEPRYDNGRTVRFSQATDAAEIAGDAAPPWEGTRVLFLQHASDPIVWWSPDLLFSRPDWLERAAGTGPDASMRWYPIVTFWQVGADMTNAGRGAGRARPQLRRLGAGRLGGGGAARRLDRRGHRTHPGGAGEVRHPPTAPNTSARQADSCACAGRRAGGLERFRRSADPAALAAAAAGRAGHGAGRDHPRPARPAARPRCGRGLRLGLRPRRRWALGVAAVDARRRRCGRRWPRASCPTSTARWLLLRIPVGTVWSEEAAFRAALGTVAARGLRAAWGRLLQAAAFGLSHVADAAATGEPVSAPCW